MYKKKYRAIIIAYATIGSISIISQTSAFSFDEGGKVISKTMNTISTTLDMINNTMDKVVKLADIFKPSLSTSTVDMINDLSTKAKNASEKAGRLKANLDNTLFVAEMAKFKSQYNTYSNTYYSNISQYQSKKIITYKYMLDNLSKNKNWNGGDQKDYKTYLTMSKGYLSKVCESQNKYITYLDNLFYYMNQSDANSAINKTKWILDTINSNFKLRSEIKKLSDYKTPAEIVTSIRDRIKLESQATCNNKPASLMTDLLAFYRNAKIMYSKDFKDSATLKKDIIILLKTNDKSYGGANNYGFELSKSKKQTFKTTDAYVIYKALKNKFGTSINPYFSGIPEDIFGNCDKGNYCYYPSSFTY